MSESAVTVLGLGPMGAALARALRAADLPTTVWNRSPERAEPLRRLGARVAADPTAAARAAELIVVCLRDHAATRAVIEGIEPGGLAGRTVVNLSSATPTEARATAAWAADLGVDWLSGAIMVPTPLIGSPEALVLYAGHRALFDRHAATLRVLAGRSEHVGTDHAGATSDEAGLDGRLPRMFRDLAAAAVEAGHGADGYSRLVELLRKPG